MRFEIVVPDSTLPMVKAKLANLVQQLSAYPELVDTFDLTSDDEAIQNLFTPELLAEIDAAGIDMKAGNKLDMDEIRERQAEIRAQWLAANPG